jgi:hypothetical protein
MQCREKEIHIKKIPRWFAKFILRSQYNPNNQQIFFTLLEPMTPQEWCLIWIPVIHPGIELPCDGERNPTGYMKACLTTLSRSHIIYPIILLHAIAPNNRIILLNAIAHNISHNSTPRDRA